MTPRPPRNAPPPATSPAGLSDGPAYGSVTLADWLGLQRWQFAYAEGTGLVPPPDLAAEQWSADAARQIVARLEEIKAIVGSEHPIGAGRAADRLGQRTDLPVDRRDVIKISAAILARTLGIHTDVAVAWQRLSAGDWATYAADVARRPQNTDLRRSTNGAALSRDRTV